VLTPRLTPRRPIETLPGDPRGSYPDAVAVEIQLAHEVRLQLERAFATRDRVGTLTHNLYRYPARFSPQIARAAIDAMTRPGDLVLDPFVGGGTTAVEAYALRRRFVGADLNTLAVLIARAKTTPLADHQFDELDAWLADAEKASAEICDLDDDKRLINAPVELVEQLSPYVSGATHLAPGSTQDAARMVLLDVGQWAVDGRANLARPDSIQAAMKASLDRLKSGLAELAESAGAAEKPRLHLGSAQDVGGARAAL
jgi:hypothetical protein